MQYAWVLLTFIQMVRPLSSISSGLTTLRNYTVNLIIYPLWGLFSPWFPSSVSSLFPDSTEKMGWDDSLEFRTHVLLREKILICYFGWYFLNDYCFSISFKFFFQKMQLFHAVIPNLIFWFHIGLNSFKEIHLWLNFSAHDIFIKINSLRGQINNKKNTFHLT